MKLPDLPEEDPKSEPEHITNKPVTAHRPEDRNQARAASRSQTGNRPGGPMRSSGQGILRRAASLGGQKPPAGPVNRGQIPPPTSSASATDLGPESRSQAGSRPEGPIRVSGQGGPPRSASSGKGINPGLKMRAIEAAARNSPPPKIPLEYRLRPNRELTRRAAWDVAAISSLVVNAILAGVLLLMAFQIRNLKATVNTVLGGLYGSFVEMDKASINTTIQVDTQIPLNFTLPVQQDTDVTLTRSVAIPGAYIILNGSNVLVNVTLPRGTILPIALNMGIPVQATVPVSLQVPVNIPMSQTQLHGPFTSLQNTIRPLYCVLNKNAQYPAGIFICK